MGCLWNPWINFLFFSYFLILGFFFSKIIWIFSFTIHEHFLKLCVESFYVVWPFFKSHEQLFLNRITISSSYTNIFLMNIVNNVWAIQKNQTSLIFLRRLWMFFVNFLNRPCKKQFFLSEKMVLVHGPHLMRAISEIHNASLPSLQKKEL